VVTTTLQNNNNNNQIQMISNFFVISPRGDTILAKQYRTTSTELGAHERSHTEALFRKIKFWDDHQEQVINPSSSSGGAGGSTGEGEEKAVGDAPPIFLMPDGLTYFHVKRNGLIFGASTARNVSPNTVLEVSQWEITR
jgi:AP-4 complex subunit mu-1